MFVVSMTRSAFKRLNTGRTSSFFFFFPWPQFRRQTDRTTMIGLAQRVQSFIVQSVASCLHPIKLISGHADRGILPCYYRCASRASMAPLTGAFPLPDQSDATDRFLLPFDRRPGRERILARLRSTLRVTTLESPDGPSFSIIEDYHGHFCPDAR